MGKKGPLWWRESDWLLRGSSAANQILLCHSGPILSDMARWMKMLLSGGLNEAGEEVFSSDVILETRSPVNAYSYLGGFYPPE